MFGHVETGINSGTSHNLSNRFSIGKVNMRLSSGPKFQEKCKPARGDSENYRKDGCVK